MNSGDLEPSLEENGNEQEQVSSEGEEPSEGTERKDKEFKERDPAKKFRKQSSKLPTGIGLPRKCCCQLRCCLCCILTFIASVIIILFVVTFSISFDTTVNDMMKEIRNENFQKIHTNIDLIFKQCEGSTKIVQAGFKEGLMDPNDEVGISKYFHTMLYDLDPSIVAFYIAFPDDRFVYVERNGAFIPYMGACPGDPVGYTINNGTHLEQFCLSGENKTAISNDVMEDDYKCTTRDWYLNAFALEYTTDIAWTDIYLYFADADDQGEVIIYYTITLLVRDPITDDPIGVFAIDMTGGSISELVQNMDVNDGGRIVVLEESGNLISLNDPEQPTLKLVGDEEQRVLTTECEDPVVRAIGKEVEVTANPRKFRKTVGGRNMFMEINNFDGEINDRGWVIAIALDRSDYDTVAIAIIITLSFTISFIVCHLISCLNCCSCCLFLRVQRLSKKMKRVSELKFHKVKVSRLHMFSEIASIELSFYKMARTILEYQAFLPDYLKEDQEDEEFEEKEDFLLGEDEQNIIGEVPGTVSSEEKKNGGEIDLFVTSKSVHDVPIDRPPSVKSHKSSKSDRLSVTGMDVHNDSMTSEMSVRLRKVRKRTAISTDVRELTCVVISFPFCEEDDDISSNVLPRIEKMISRYRGIIISFNELEIVCGFNCNVKQNLWKGHLTRGVEFALDVRNTVRSIRLRIGVCSGKKCLLKIFGSRKNRVRKIIIPVLGRAKKSSFSC